MISDEILRITEQLPQGVRLVAVSKYHPVEAIREAYAVGQRLFGESHAQEIQRKHEELSALDGLEWHFIGHLQTNKVKGIVPYVTLIHSVDSPRLLAEIHKQAVKVGRKQRCLLQLHVAQEETKFGFSPSEAMDYLDKGEWRAFSGIQLAGVMAMATNTDNLHQIQQEFRCARRFFEEARDRYFPDEKSSFCELSMGMSEDWKIAVEEGATLIRIGTQIFGERQY